MFQPIQPRLARAGLLLALLALVAAAPLLAGCHTAAGAGQDISATGQALTNGARKATQ